MTREASDATMTFRALGLPSGVAREASDATMTFRALGLPSDVAREASDATMPFAIVGLPSDATMSFRVVSQPAHGPAHLNGDREEAELRTLIYSILAGLKPREREVIELSFRHDLHDDDLAIALGVSWSRAHALAARARGRLEEALNALHIALTRRETCPVLGELLTDWDGQLTEDTRNLVSWHIGECQTCAHHGWGALRPAAFSRLLPLAPLPPELREQVLSSCTSTAEDAVAYRRRVVRRAESIWFTTFSHAIRRVSWASIRANPGMAIVAVAVVLWVAAAASVTLLTFAGSHAAYARQPAGRSATHAYAPQTGAGTSSGSPAAAPATATTRTSAAASPSPSFTRPASYVSSPVQPSPSPEASKSPPSHRRRPRLSHRRRPRPSRRRLDRRSRPRLGRRPRPRHPCRRRLEAGLYQLANYSCVVAPSPASAVQWASWYQTARVSACSGPRTRSQDGSSAANWSRAAAAAPAHPVQYASSSRAAKVSGWSGPLFSRGRGAARRTGPGHRRRPRHARSSRPG